MPPKKSRKPLDTEKLYRKLVEHMNEGVWMGNKDERTIYANPKFCNMMGYTLKEMLGKKSYVFWDEESAKRVKEVNETKRKKGISSSYEGNLLTKAGKKIPVLLSGTPLEDGGTIGIMTDISELKKKEEKERILSSAIQYSTDAIIIFNTKGQITSWNRGAKIIFGYKKDEAVGQSLEWIFSGEEILPLLKNRKVLYNIELTGVHKSKKPISVSATLTPILNEKKHAKFWLLIARDITSQVKFQEELALKYQKIRDAYNNFGIIRRQMEYIFELLDLVEKTQDKRSIADFIVNSIIMLTSVDACVLRTYNQKKNTMDLLSCFGVAKDWTGKASLKYKNSLAERAFKNDAPLKIIDIAKEPRYQSQNLARKNNFSSLLLIPLQFKTRPVGTLSLYAGPDKKLEILENEFIEKYARLLELVVATL